jgi:anti-sigma factor RsiW
MKECARVKKILSRYADGETSDTDSSLVKAHLDICALCHKEFAGLSQIKKLLTGRERKSLPPDYLVSRLRDRIAGERVWAERSILAGMGSLSRRLIPVPVAVIALSALFLMSSLRSDSAAYSLEDHILSGKAATMDTALGLVLGEQN